MKFFIAITLGFLLGFIFNFYVPVFAQAVDSDLDLFVEPIDLDLEIYEDDGDLKLSFVESIYKSATSSVNMKNRYIQEEILLRLERIERVLWKLQ